MKRIEPADLTDSAPVWVLDLEFAGTTYRVASEPVVVKTAAGDQLSYVGGLEVGGVEETLGRLRFDVATQRATVRCVLPDSVPALRAKGHDLLQGVAALYLTTIRPSERRLTVPTSPLLHSEMWLQVVGDVRRPAYGRPDAPAGFLEFTIQRAPWQAQTSAVLPDLVIDSQRWPAHTDEVTGKRYPLIFGEPGVYRQRGGAKTSIPGAPAYAVERSGATAIKILISGHPVRATSVTLYDPDGGSAVVPIVAFTDGLGDWTTYTLTAAGSINYDSDQFYSCWDQGDTSIANPVRGGSLSNAVDVVAYLLLLSEMPIDVPAWEALAEQLPAFKVHGYINDDSTGWDIAAEHILPMLPIALRYTRQGLAPVLYDPALRDWRTVAHVYASSVPDAPTYGGEWVAVGDIQVETEPEDRLIAITVNYARNASTGDYHRRVTWRPDGYGPKTRRAISTRRGDESLSTYLDSSNTRGSGSTEELDLDLVWDQETADAVAAWRGRLLALPTEVTTYAAPWHWGWLQVGDSLTITDEARSIIGRIVTVNAKTWAGDRWEIEVIIDEDVVRDVRDL